MMPRATSRVVEPFRVDRLYGSGIIRSVGDQLALIPWSTIQMGAASSAPQVSLLATDTCKDEPVSADPLANSTFGPGRQSPPQDGYITGLIGTILNGTTSPRLGG